MNKKSSKNLFLILLISLNTFFIILALQTTTVSAELTDATDLDVLKSAPAGIPIKEFMSNSAPTPYSTSSIKNPYNTNFAQIVDHSGKNTSDGNVISLANGTSTYGSMWSNDRTFDINKDQTISAWLYFGNGDDVSTALNSEGIAFVLQNDSRKNGALGAGLEGMGVYGYDASKFTGGFLNSSGEPADKNFILNTAIQNSVALEFDSSLNSFYGLQNAGGKPLNNDPKIVFNSTALFGSNYFSLDGYDTSVGTSSSNTIPTDWGFSSGAKYGASGKDGHIALTYPNYTNTYKQTDISYSSYNPFKNGFVMVHDYEKEAPLVDDYNPDTKKAVYWHHVTIKWLHKTSQLEYSFNDYSPEGLENHNTRSGSDFQRIDTTTKVDTSKLKTTDGKVSWGFTGANGLATGVSSKLIAFDSIPDQLYAEGSSQIVDKDLNNKLIDNTTATTDNAVNNGDNLNLTYKLNYVRGREDWNGITAKIKLPTEFNPTPDDQGNIGTIAYSGTDITENISQKELADGYITHKLSRNLGSITGTDATITLNGKANNNGATKDVSVKAQPANFAGTNSIVMTSSPKFTILAPKTYTLNLKNTAASNDLDLIFNSDDATNLPTSINYSDNHNFTDSTNIVYQVTVDGKTYLAGGSASGSKYDQTLDLREIITNGGTNFWDVFPNNSTKQVQVKALDTANALSSNTITYNVSTHSDKSLSLNVSNDLKFQNVNYDDHTKYLKRKTNFNLSVTSLQEPWNLSVATNGMYLDGKTLEKNLSLFYRQTPTSNDANLNNTPTLIEQDSTSHNEKFTDNISKDWTENSGLLLKQLGANGAGQYKGTVTWTLTSSIDTN